MRVEQSNDALGRVRVSTRVGQAARLSRLSEAQVKGTDFVRPGQASRLSHITLRSGRRKLYRNLCLHFDRISI